MSSALMGALAGLAGGHIAGSEHVTQRAPSYFSNATASWGTESMRLSSTGPQSALPAFLFVAGSEEGGSLFKGFYDPPYTGGRGTAKKRGSSTSSFPTARWWCGTFAPTAVRRSLRKAQGTSAAPTRPSRKVSLRRALRTLKGRRSRSAIHSPPWTSRSKQWWASLQ